VHSTLLLSTFIDSLRAKSLCGLPDWAGGEPSTVLPAGAAGDVGGVAAGFVSADAAACFAAGTFGNPALDAASPAGGLGMNDTGVVMGVVAAGAAAGAAAGVCAVLCALPLRRCKEPFRQLLSFYTARPCS